MPTISDLLKYDKAHPDKAGTSSEEKLFVYGLIRLLQPHHIVEIGVRAAHLTCWIALALKHNGFGKVHSVDIWEGTDGGCGASKRHAEERLKATKLWDHHVNLYQEDSAQWFRQRSNRSIDFVWIDGGHKYKVAARDIAEGLRVARRMVAVHDAFNLPGVYDALIDASAKYPGTWIDGFRGIWLAHIGGGAKPPEGSKYS